MRIRREPPSVPVKRIVRPLLGSSVAASCGMLALRKGNDGRRPTATPNAAPVAHPMDPIRSQRKTLNRYAGLTPEGLNDARGVCGEGNVDDPERGCPGLGQDQICGHVST